MINRSTGLGPGMLDWGAMYGITLWLGVSVHWTIPMLALPPVFFAGLERFPRWLRVSLPLTLTAAALGYAVHRSWQFSPPRWSSLEFSVLIAVSIASIPVVVSYRHVSSVGDRTGRPLAPHRVQWAFGWAIVIAWALTLSGSVQLADLAPLWAALAGSTLGWALHTAHHRIRAT